MRTVDSFFGIGKIINLMFSRRKNAAVHQNDGYSAEVE